jgi:hypothetical protein
VLAAGEMLKFACTPCETSCIVGNLFIELEPPCEICAGTERLTLRGTTYAGRRETLIVTDYGFLYSGEEADISAIRERRCVYAGRG